LECPTSHPKYSVSPFQKIHIGVFDLLTVNGKPVRQNYAWKLEEVGVWLENCKLCHVLPYIKPTAIQDIERFWIQRVEKEGYEGLVARSNNELYKIKPVSEVDAVIIAINKRELFHSSQVTSIKIALMNAEGNFVEIGDCASGIDWELRTRLWELMDYKTGEDDQAVWVKPKVVCTVQYTDLFKGRNMVYSYDEKQGYQHIGTTELARLRSPRLMDFRSDKRVTPEDLRVEQLPLDFWKDVWAISKSLGRGE